MKFGLSQSAFDLVEEQVVKPLNAKGAKVWVFGSLARGDHKEFSDLDLYIESPSKLERLVGNIEESLMKSDLPIKVDLVQSSHLASSYRESIEEDKVLWER